MTCHVVYPAALHPAIGPVARSGVNQHYIDAVISAGGAPVLVPLGLDESGLASIYSTMDGLLLPGGDDVHPSRYGHEVHPKLGAFDHDRDDLELTLAAWALRDDLPVLGICRGIQVLAVAAGGTLYQDLPSQLQSDTLHDVRDFGRDHLTHGLEVEPGSRLADALGHTSHMVNSFHHQAVWDVPPDFEVSARSTDGVIEGIEGIHHHFAVGVQCHPEGIWSTTAPQFSGLFNAFVRAASDRRGRGLLTA
jgi:putative glutamine amidotransferase